MSSYEAVYGQRFSDPESFWAEAAEAVCWFKKWDRVLDGSRPPFYRWFAGGSLNSCYNALDRHVEDGRADQPALIYDSPGLLAATRRVRSRADALLPPEWRKAARF